VSVPAPARIAVCSPRMTDRRPPLVLITGAPATGKSTLARHLAGTLRLPLITKDGIKEVLGDALGAADRDRSKELGAASHALLYAVTGWLLDAGAGAIVESNFWRGVAEPGLQPLVTRSRAVIIHCEVSDDAVMRRFAARGSSGKRHPVHFDGAELPSLRKILRQGRFDPLDIDAPLLRVDTHDGYIPSLAAVLAFIETCTARHAR
jgi:predicted kinase